MRYTKLLGTFSIVVILSLLAIAVPATPVQAAPTIALDPTEARIGDGVTVSGTDFPPSDIANPDRHVDLYFSSDSAVVGNYIDSQVTTYEKWTGFVWVNEQGEFQKAFEVPAELSVGDEEVEVGGTYYVYVTLYNSIYIRAKATLTVIGGEVSIQPGSGPVDTEVEITGSGFAANEDIAIEYDGSGVNIKSGDSSTDSNGDFFSIILVPESTAGTHTIAAIVSGIEVGADFTVEPELILAPTSGEAGAAVSVIGTGFSRRKEVTLYFKNAPVVTSLTDGDGSFSTSFSVPDLETGIYDVEAEDADGNLDAVKFTVNVPPPTTTPAPTPTPTPTPSPSPSNITISATSNSVGANVVIGGVGFKPSGNIVVKYDGEEISTATADGNGIFWAVFRVPKSKSGDHVVSVSDGTNTAEDTFTVESTAPSVPIPLLPEMGVEIGKTLIFDWKDVTDESAPVTYDLQVATSGDFSSGSVVLDKKELGASTYTVTETEQKKLTGQETLYYWRVRAVDAASNASAWSGIGEFNVPAPFSMPNWALYTLIGLGALVLFVIGYWLGRRTAYYY